MFIEMLTGIFFGIRPLVFFFGGLFFGEEGVLLLSIFSSKYSHNFLSLIIFSSLGVILADIFWFFIGRLEVMSKLKNYKNINKNYTLAKKFINGALKNNHFLLLLFTKIFYGFRIFTTMYLSRRIKFKEFILYEIIIVPFVVFVVAGIGWFGGRGFGWILHTYKSLQLAVLVLACGLILFYIVQLLVGKALSRKLSSKKI